MTFALVLDWGNYTLPLTPAQRAFVAANVDTVVLGLQDAAMARAFKAQLQGITKLRYYIDKPGRDLTIPDAGAPVYVDIELGCFTRRADVLAAIPQLRARNLAPGIYGNETSIVPVMGVSTELADLPLWDANYREGVVDFSSFEPFNGWTSPEMLQYSSGGVAGINCDLSLIEITQPVPQEEEEYTMANPTWVFWKDGPPAGTAGYRTYQALVTASGPKKYHVKSAAEEEALRKAGIITRKTPIGLTLEQLKAFAGGPEPDE